MRTVHDAAGGHAGLLALARAWHARCLADPVASHPFGHGGLHPQHVERLAAYWGEALGGPPAYTDTMGDEAGVLRMHAGNGTHRELDALVVQLFDGAMDDVGLTGQPDKVREGGGFSAIVAPNATYVAGPHRDDEAILYGEIDLGMIPFAKFFADSAGHYARPDVFSFGIDGRAQTPITGAPGGAVDQWHVIGSPDEPGVIEGDAEPRLLTPPTAD